ncbi:zf-TFIIB domain-containing protein [Pseudidiomarina terrestris]|uniref:Zf-TFIIB domain-containing protein n=1 Tax=Pseudidiomarina terrestris TaxID=2820060 RepID=A0AAW7R1P6_9GAMM|nr:MULTISPECIES: zf-TFIIB domain-containing protein [unclassified Pseudidiomarina]MDN7124555.1 zf-TFIIB domain-containing protein [Pseudidiomarina sp. 1APP75-32.1]MDN7126898.1 zf-TFIIB domain-containing protein [Pseudidiomarina sp. 1APR75-33.1]MDN7129154.1 zf-TFIIB domain-containing protein [Pseudidiomarina sp. 1APR75-15]MDN7134583.1 zf-TFIIB domain-containing protein [Pseudidiomarina sp. 1ASP75-5]MDN7136748.1 zf-TFIIB domain-containing protein [Pseudidiomarina sp. 1ASP75-14]
MKCPVCADENLMMTERQGVEIDYCPKCRGVWLDRGELDKIIERTQPEAPQARPAPEPREPRHVQQPHYQNPNDSYGYKKRKKKSLLGELFDF